MRPHPLPSDTLTWHGSQMLGAVNSREVPSIRPSVIALFSPDYPYSLAVTLSAFSMRLFHPLLPAAFRAFSHPEPLATFPIFPLKSEFPIGAFMPQLGNACCRLLTPASVTGCCGDTTLRVASTP